MVDIVGAEQVGVSDEAPVDSPVVEQKPPHPYKDNPLMNPEFEAFDFSDFRNAFGVIEAALETLPSKFVEGLPEDQIPGRKRLLNTFTQTVMNLRPGLAGILDRINNNFIDIGASEWIKHVHHDFRTPYTVMLTSSENMNNYFDKLTPEKRMGYLERSANASYTFLHVMDQYDDFFECRDHPERILNPFAQDSMSGMERVFFEAPGVTIEGVDDEGALEMSAIEAAEAFELSISERNMIGELIKNAKQHSGEGDTPVHITISNVEVPQEDAEPKIMRVIKVNNKGRVIPADQLSEVTKPSYKVDEQRREIEFDHDLYGERGAGFGLTFNKMYCEAKGGSFDIASNETDGTTVTLTLP